jgi:hypothetical protein
MRLVHCFLAALALAATALGGISSASVADHDARSAIEGRQKVREELTAALAKGHLTRMDQYRLLVLAKEVLSTEDLRGFEQTLDRIAARQAAAHGATAAVRSGTAARAEDDDTPRVVAASGNEELADASGPSVGSRFSATPVASDLSAEEIPAGIGRPSTQVQLDDVDAYGCDGDAIRPKRQWLALDMFTGIEAFKGPLDVGNANGNFGLRIGANGAVPIFQKLGIGLQAGMAADLTNLEGSPYPFPNATLRDQIFTTVGMFQRINRGDNGAFTWGFAYDWLFDDYYANFHFGQWRVKGEWEVDAYDAFGAQASLPEHGSTEDTLVNLDGSPLVISFKPLTQGYLYWTHTFENCASVTGKFGVAERPGNFVFGADGCVPLTRNFALTGGFTYIMPDSGAGPIAQTQEIWNVSVGVEFVPGGFRHCGALRFRPFMPVADNGSFAVREVQ